MFRSYLAPGMIFEVETSCSNIQKRHQKYAIKRVVLDKIRQKVTRWISIIEKNVWNFFRIFRSYLSPGIILKFHQHIIIKYAVKKKVEKESYL